MLTKMKYKCITSIVVASMVLPFAWECCFAESSSIDVDGRFYEWNEKGTGYPFSSGDSISTNDADTYGSFSITGDMEAMDDHNGVISYLVHDNDYDVGTVSFTYSYDDSLLSDNDSGDVNWHITDDNHKKIDDSNIVLPSKMLSGAIIIQTSLDGVTWVEDEVYTDVFETTPVQNESIYNTVDIQLLNGTYYRFIVLYRQRRLVGTNGVWVFRTSDYEYLERAEIYEFYLEAEMSYEYQASTLPRTAMGDVVNAGSHNGFEGTDPITSDRDPHYNWTLGNFFVSGYSDVVTESDGTYTFLKNVGDRVNLSFELLQDINCLNGNENLIINNDKDGRDSYFQTDRNLDFEHGALIIRFTDHQGVAHDPIIYTDYLNANCSTNANTRVNLFEEGNYEVALDYEIRNKEGFDSYSNYRIFFKFQVRNGNCMVFPFDSLSGSELDDGAMTRNGFTLDLAGSHYLHITVTRYVINSSGTGLDQRWSRQVSDGTTYEDDGIYWIHVTNDYAPDSQFDKVICVGDDQTINDYYEDNIRNNTSVIYS